MAKPINVAAYAGGPGSGSGGGGGGGSGDGSGNGGGGGRPPGAGTKKGDLFGDQYVLYRDVDPTDGGGNGEPVLDQNGQPILVGSDGLPIYYVLTTDGDYEIPADRLPYAQTVDLGRANVARAPDAVMNKSLDAALAKVEAATTVSTDAAGRILCDGVAIDSPLENLALYKYLMTAGGHTEWPAVVTHWSAVFQALVGGDHLHPEWDPSSLLGAAFAKESPISLDAVLYENTVIGVNPTTQSASGLSVDYFEFTNGQNEAYTYDRAARFSDTWLQWYADTDGDPTTLELVQASVMDAVFNDVVWTDEYLSIGADPSVFVTASAERSGLNDFAQAVDDARAVINFMHLYGATTAAAPPPAMPVIAASANTTQDTLTTGGGPQLIDGGTGKDVIDAGGGPDTVMGGNGKDTLLGGPGPDVLIGGNGPDVLEGGAAHDVLTGGRGPDRFVYSSSHDAPGGGSSGGGHDDGGHDDDGHGGGGDHGDGHGEDGHGEGEAVTQGSAGRAETITDFQPGTDVIDLRQVGADHFASGPAAHAVWVRLDGDATLVLVDTDGQVSGEHPNEMTIVLSGVLPEALSAGDFLF